ncbi:MAG: gliding motility-associated C-terminal domain-containing protein [Chitinophagales bacterium]
MKRKLFFLVFIFLIFNSKAQTSFTTSTTISTCSSNGSITVTPTSGSTPFLYQIVSSSTGIIRPAQNVPVFNNLPQGTYTIRLTDANNFTAQGNATITGNYVPLTFNYTQNQSTLTINPVNGKPPYQFTYSKDNGITYRPLTDTNIFKCFEAGNYIFRVYDSCSNFYSENVVMNPVIINADFSCNVTGNMKSITLNSVSGGNGGYTYNATGFGYNQSNTTGNFSGISFCNKNVSVKVTDVCNVTNSFLVCPTPDFGFEITCVNFKDHTITIGNVTGGGGIPYKYIANDIISSSPTITNIPNTQDSIVAGIVDSCGNRSLVTIRPNKVLKIDSLICIRGDLSITTGYGVDYQYYTAFQPTRYQSTSGPTSFDVLDTFRVGHDTSFVLLHNLQNGTYTFKVTNACGDEINGAFTYHRKCYRSFKVEKKQECDRVRYQVFKDCKIDTDIVFMLYDKNGVLLQQNSTGSFAINNNTCYRIKMRDTICDTILLDFVNPLNLKLRTFQNSCDVLTAGVDIQENILCSKGQVPQFSGILAIVIADSNFNILKYAANGVFDTVPPNAYWIYGSTTGCNTDTIRYVKNTTLKDTLRFCITPSVKIIGTKCKFAWQVQITVNPTGASYNLTGNGVNITSSNLFLGLDTGMYVLKSGCNVQYLYLPKYYDFNVDIQTSCPKNGILQASHTEDSNYIRMLGAQYFYSLCNPPIIDYNIQEIGTTNPLIYSVNGYFDNLKTGTYYGVYFKGNQDCNYFADTVFTPFYTRPKLTATYGLVCNGNNASVKATVVGGLPPYRFDVIGSSIPTIITDSTYVIYNNLPLGTTQFRVSDACGISIDYSTEVLSVNFEPTFKKKCDGQVQLIAPDIFNTTYVWTNKNGDTIGTTPSVYVSPNGTDSFTVSIKHLTCSLSKYLLVADFSSSIVTANAGIDFTVDTNRATLNGNVPPTTAIGTWKQIDPSSGNTVFSDIHDPKATTIVDVFPGQYTYLWTVTDTVVGCVDEDTVVVSYLRCPGIVEVRFTKNVRNATCINNGQIDVSIIQTSTPIHYLWNTGDTTASIKNLTDAMYIVRIYDETSCTQDIYDTTIISGTKPTKDSIQRSVCDGDTVTINNKNYFTAGNYTDTLRNSLGCDSILFIKINIGQKTFGDSVTLYFCDGDSYTLPDSTLTFTHSISFYLGLVNSNGCDSLIYYDIIFNPSYTKTIDTAICAGNVYQLPNGNNVSISGNYIDSFTTIHGCDSIITTNLFVKDTLQPLNLGNDQLICADDSIVLLLNYPQYANYVWQDNSNQANYTIKKDGIYYVKVYDGCTETSDTITIQTKSCTCNFYIPTAFSPNHDAVNDLFLPLRKCDEFKEYKFTVYNRWNELMFQTTDALSGWNGWYKNEEQPLDTYIWLLEYYDVYQNKKIFLKGTVTLLR